MPKKDYVCAYTQKVLKFEKMMKNLGNEVIHYEHEGLDLARREHVTVLTNKDLEIAYGNYDWHNSFYRYDYDDHAYQTFYKNAIAEIGKRKQKNDFILPSGGLLNLCVMVIQTLFVLNPVLGMQEGILLGEKFLSLMQFIVFITVYHL